MTLLFSYDDTIHKKGRVIYLDKFSRYEHRYRFLLTLGHPMAQLLILLRSVLMIPAAVSGESTTMYKLVLSANSRISEPISFTMSFI